MSIYLKSQISKQSKINKNDSLSLINASFQSKPKDFSFSNLNQGLKNSFRDLGQSKKSSRISSRQEKIHVENQLMNCKYFINMIEDQINFFKNSLQSTQNNRKDSDKFIRNIQGMIGQFLREYRKVSNREKYKLILRLLSCLYVLKNQQIYLLIPLEQMRNSIVYLGQLFQPLNQALKNEKNQDTYAKHQSKVSGLKQNSKRSDFQDKKINKKTQAQTFNSERPNKNQNLSLELNRKSLSKSKLKKLSLHNKQSLVSNNTSRVRSIHKLNERQQVKMKDLDKELKQVVDVLSMIRIDWIFGLVFNTDRVQFWQCQRLINDKVFVNTAMGILQTLRHPIIQRKLQLYYSPSDFNSFQNNCKTLLQKIKQITQTQSQVNLNSSNAQIDNLKSQIYELITQQILKQHNSRTNQQELSSNNLNSFSFASKSKSKNVQSFRKSPKNHENQQKDKNTERIPTFCKIQNQSQNNFIVQQLNSHNRIEIQKCSSKSISKNSFPQQTQFKSLQSINNMFQYQTSLTNSQKSKLSNSYKKQVCQSKRTSPINMVVSMRKELTTSMKNHYQLNRNTQSSNYNQNYNLPNNNKNSCNNLFQQKLINSKSNRKIQRRSGFVTYNRVNQSSIKRISTRWNNLNQSPLSNLIEQSKQTSQKTNRKNQVKSQFSFSNQNKIKIFDQQEDSNYSSNPSLISVAKKKSLGIQESSSNSSIQNQTNSKMFFIPKILNKIQSSKSLNKSQVTTIKNFQIIQTKVINLRLMTLLHFNFYSFLSFLELKSQLRKIKSEKQEKINPNKRKKTFYQSKQFVQKLIDNNNSLIKVFDLTECDSKEQKEILIKYHKFKKKQIKNYVQNEKIMQKLLRKYLQKKQKNIQDQIISWKTGNAQSSQNTLNDTKIKKLSNKFLIKPFYIHLDHPDKKDRTKQSGDLFIKFEKVSFQVSGILNRSFEEDKKDWKSTEVSLKYDKYHQQKQIQIFNKNQIERINKKSLSIIEPNEQSEGVKILEFPLSVIVKSTQFRDNIIAQEIDLLITLRAIQQNDESCFQQKDQVKDSAKRKKSRSKKNKNKINSQQYQSDSQYSYSSLSSDQQGDNELQDDSSSQSSDDSNSFSSSSDNSSQSLSKDQILLSQQQSQSQNVLQNQSDFYRGYFQLQSCIEKLLLRFLQLNKYQMGTRLVISKLPTSQKISQQTMFNSNKLSLLKSIKILKQSPLLKNLLKSNPKGLQMFQEFIERPNQEQNSNKNSDFIKLEMELKIIKKSTMQNPSQKKLIVQKYSSETTHKTMINLNHQKIIRNFQQVRVIRKVNTYFFLKRNFIVVNKIDNIQESLQNIKVYLIEETYCQNFHQLYERQVFPINPIRQFAENIFDQKYQKPETLQKVILFFDSNISKLFQIPTQKFLKNRKSSTKRKTFSSNIFLEVFQNNLKESEQQIEQDIYEIKVQQIPDNNSKTQSTDVQIIQHFSQNQKYNSFSWVGSNSKGKVGYTNNDRTQKNHSRALYMQKGENGGSIKMHFEEKLRQKNTRKKQDQFFFPSNLNAFGAKPKRTTIEMNKNQSIQGQIGQITPFKTNLSGVPRSRKNIGFTQMPQNSDFNDFKGQTDNEHFFTQKELGQETQKSLKSHHSKSRLPRHAHHISSLMPTSVKVLKSLKNIESSMLNKKCKRKYLLPSLNKFLSSSNFSFQLDQNYKRLNKTDNFINFAQQSQIEIFSNKSPLNSNIKGMQVCQKANNILLIDKGKFYMKKGLGFLTLIKRNNKFLLCLVQYWILNELQTQVQVLSGIYNKNANTIKIISGKILTQFFNHIMKSHKQFQNYLNCQLNNSFEINNNPLKRIHINLKTNPQLTLKYKQEYSNNMEFVIRPNIGIQKLIKTKCITQFVLRMEQSRNHYQILGYKTNIYCIVSIFAYLQLPNQSIFVHAYLQKSSKYILFVVEGNVLFNYLKDIVQNILYQKILFENLKSKSIDRLPSRQSQSHKKRRQRLSIFTSPHQVIESKSSFQPCRNKTSQNSQFGIKSRKSTVLSKDNSFSQHTINIKITNWKELSQEIKKVRNQIKFDNHFSFKLKENRYFLEFTDSQNVNYVGTEIISKKIQYKIRVEKSNPNNFRVIPKMLEIDSISFEDRKFSLLSAFTAQTFNKIMIKQKYIEYVDKLQNAFHYSESLQNILRKQRDNLCEIQGFKNPKQRNLSKQRNISLNHTANKMKFFSLYYLPLNKTLKPIHHGSLTLNKYKQHLLNDQN